MASTSTPRLNVHRALQRRSRVYRRKTEARRTRPQRSDIQSTMSAQTGRWRQGPGTHEESCETGIASTSSAVLPQLGGEVAVRSECGVNLGGCGEKETDTASSTTPMRIAPREELNAPWERWRPRELGVMEEEEERGTGRAWRTGYACGRRGWGRRASPLPVHSSVFAVNGPSPRSHKRPRLPTRRVTLP